MREITKPIAPIFIFFAVAYFFLPVHDADKNIVMHGDMVRLSLSIGIIGTLLFLLYRHTRAVVPVIFGITPIIYSLVNSGAVYGSGVEIFYFIAVLLIVKKLPIQEDGNRIKVKGLIPITLFITATFGVHLVRHACGLKPALFIQMTTFVLVIYLVHKRIDRMLFHKILYSVLIGNSILLLWLVTKLRFPALLHDQMGGLINPTVVGGYALTAIIAFALIIIEKNIKMSARHIIFFLALITIVFLTESRSSVVQLFILAPLLLFKIKRYVLTNKFIRFTLPLAVIIIALVLPVILSGKLDSFFDLVKRSHLGGRMETLLVSNRKAINDFSWNLASQYPLWGVGMGSFTWYSGQEDMVTAEGEPLYHHNVIAGTAAENGYTGLLLFLLWYASFLFTRKTPGKFCPYLITFAVCAMIGGITHGMFLCFQSAIPLLLAVKMESFYA